MSKPARSSPARESHRAHASSYAVKAAANNVSALATFWFWLSSWLSSWFWSWFRSWPKPWPKPRPLAAIASASLTRASARFQSPAIASAAATFLDLTSDAFASARDASRAADSYASTARARASTWLVCVHVSSSRATAPTSPRAASAFAAAIEPLAAIALTAAIRHRRSRRAIRLVTTAAYLRLRLDDFADLSTQCFRHARTH
mmetsp:Transcript_10877/g.45280  ORF Transcript_10877/g.45280 Transcript_10877/m.45280 type:complete len:203 (+) Transcript_10877:865-1473(+)